MNGAEAAFLHFDLDRVVVFDAGSDLLPQPVPDAPFLLGAASSVIIGRFFVSFLVFVRLGFFGRRATERAAREKLVQRFHDIFRLSLRLPG